MRAIDADAVPQEFWEYEFDGKWRGCTIKDLLDSQPTIQPEIIRCKDCQYWNKGSCECPEHAVNCQDYYVGDIETNGMERIEYDNMEMLYK